MLDHDDLKWIAANVTELNRLLQQVARSTDQVRQHKAEGRSLEILGEQVEQASKISQSLFDCVTSRIFSAAASGAAPLQPVPVEKIVTAPAAPTRVSVKMPVGEVALAGANGGDPPILNSIAASCRDASIQTRASRRALSVSRRSNVRSQTENMT